MLRPKVYNALVKRMTNVGQDCTRILGVDMQKENGAVEQKRQKQERKLWVKNAKQRKMAPD